MNLAVVFHWGMINAVILLVASNVPNHAGTLLDNMHQQNNMISEPTSFRLSTNIHNGAPIRVNAEWGVPFTFLTHPYGSRPIPIAVGPVVRRPVDWRS